MSSILNGGCLCGAVRYRVHGQPFHVTHCHCISCRKASGAAFLTWFTVRLIELEWLSEKPVYYHSSTAVQRGFCPHCGATLSYQHESDPDDIDITAATLDAPEQLAPEFHAWWQEHLDWGEPAKQAALPVHERSHDGA